MVDKRNPTDSIPNLAGLTIGDFWQWALSDILENLNRGVYAEFLIASALGIIDDNVRDSWQDWDLTYKDMKLEVKTSAYRQTWEQKHNSSIKFDIKPKKSTNERTADVYVFCLFTEINDEHAHERVIDPTFWEFYIVREVDLPQQQSISINPLCKLCSRLHQPSPVQYDHIKPILDKLISSLN